MCFKSNFRVAFTMVIRTADCSVFAVGIFLINLQLFWALCRGDCMLLERAVLSLTCLAYHAFSTSL